jgi:isopentenyl diphosphate isomerase/L-lactate dehydrogenase-like FMN-dependent dehydrogenase
MPDLVNLRDYERAARERVQPGAWAYIAGGAGDERTLRDNVRAFRRRRLRPRVLVDVSTVKTAADVLGEEVAMPILVAPTGHHGLAHPEAERATARGAAAAGTVFCLSTPSTARVEEVAEAAPHGRRWFQLYWGEDRGFVSELLARVSAAGFAALVLTVDLPVFGRRERDLRAGFVIPRGSSEAPASRLVDSSLTWRDLEWLREACPLPLVVKGVLTAEDALLAVEHGAAAVVVSNHGGRQLDGVPASLDALPEVLEAVADRAEVYVDGGVRRGTDVAIALGLGAKAVLVGRPVLWGLAVGGADGVRAVLELLRAEFELTLRLLGCRSPADVTPAHVTV